MNRRKFIQSTTAATTLLASLETYATPIFNEGVNDVGSASKSDIQHPTSDMKIMATNWGTYGDIESFCVKAKAAGYDGIEIWWITEAHKRKELFDVLKKHDLAIGFLVGSGNSNFDSNFDEFSKNLEDAAMQTIVKPLYINCHSGKDYFSTKQAEAFFSRTAEISKLMDMPVYHETHRGRLLYSAPLSRAFMERNPNLQITLDISHWCCVHESLLEDQQETVALALSRTGHIHARVGHAEGPQVSDPRAPEWDKAVKAHFAWWDKVVERRRKEGKQITILTEFGPPDYMPTLPYTRQPVANQWEINAYMMKVLRERYK
jgi:sugar phosphate isomerase/epimerase